MIIKTLKAVEQMVFLYNEICFHECVFLEAAFERQDPVVCSPGPLLALALPLPLSSCTQDAPQAPWRGCDASSHLNPLTLLSSVSAKA